MDQQQTELDTFFAVAQELNAYGYTLECAVKMAVEVFENPLDLLQLAYDAEQSIFHSPAYETAIENAFYYLRRELLEEREVALLDKIAEQPSADCVQARIDFLQKSIAYRYKSRHDIESSIEALHAILETQVDENDFCYLENRITQMRAVLEECGAATAPIQDEIAEQFTDFV